MTGGKTRILTEMKQMKSMGITPKKILIFAVIVYFIVAQYISVLINTVVFTGYKSYGQENCFETFVSDEIFDKMSIRGKACADDGIKAGVYEMTGPFVLHWFTGAKAVYVYTHYEFGENMELLSAAWDSVVFVNMDMEAGKWTVTKIWEPISVTQYVPVIKEWLSFSL